jgi:hypothetical protein
MSLDLRQDPEVGADFNAALPDQRVLVAQEVEAVAHK